MSSPATAVPELPLHVHVAESVPVIVIPETLGFDDLRAWIRDRLPQQADLIGGRASRLDVGARELKLFDLRRLIHLLRDEFGIEVTGLYVTEQSVHRYAERELKLKLFFLDDDEADPTPDEVDTEVSSDVDGGEAAPEATDDGEPSSDEADASGEHVDEDAPADDDLPSGDKIAATTLPNDLDLDTVEPRAVNTTPAPAPPRDDPKLRTMPVHRTLRSGSSVRFEGDIIVYGDVNPGAQVVATGNIVVLGSLKGVAHAGAGGDEEAFIMALSLRPTQVRIARKIAVPPARDSGAVPERAFVDGDQIVIEPYLRRP